MKITNKKISISTITLEIFFIILLIFAVLFQPLLKHKVQLEFLIAGITILISLFSKPPLKTSIPFYIFLGYLVYITCFTAIPFFANIINPEERWMERNGERYRTMQMNWIWGVLAGLIVAPVSVYFYSKKRAKNKILEVGLTACYIICAFVIYIMKL